MGTSEFELHIAQDTCEMFALYRNGARVFEGEWVSDYVDDIMKHLGVTVVNGEDFLLGTGLEDPQAADNLDQVRQFARLEPWEKRAKELEDEADAMEKNARMRAAQLRRDALQIRQDRR